MSTFCIHTNSNTHTQNVCRISYTKIKYKNRTRQKKNNNIRCVPFYLTFFERKMVKENETTKIKKTAERKICYVGYDENFP